MNLIVDAVMLTLATVGGVCGGVILAIRHGLQRGLDPNHIETWSQQRFYRNTVRSSAAFGMAVGMMLAAHAEYTEAQKRVPSYEEPATPLLPPLVGDAIASPNH